MSHDIRTPMNGIMGMTSIAIESLDNPPRVRSCLKKIIYSSPFGEVSSYRSISILPPSGVNFGLITDMLDMSKIEKGYLSMNIEPVSLREIVHNVLTIIQPQIQEKGQQFHIYIDDIRHENVCTESGYCRFVR